MADPARHIAQVGVFCGSSPGNAPHFMECARDFGALMARRGQGLVYGGGRKGLMGVLADAVLEGGGTVQGVIPRAMVDREVAHHGVTELVLTDDMFERKGRMMAEADAFVALPGGIGTLDEVFEVITWNQLGYLSKPCGLLNVGGFFSPLLAALDGIVDNGFLNPAHRRALLVDDDPGALLDALVTWTPAALDKLDG